MKRNRNLQRRRRGRRIRWRTSRNRRPAEQRRRTPTKFRWWRCCSIWGWTVWCICQTQTKKMQESFYKIDENRPVNCELWIIHKNCNSIQIDWTSLESPDKSCQESKEFQTISIFKNAIGCCKSATNGFRIIQKNAKRILNGGPLHCKDGENTSKEFLHKQLVSKWLNDHWPLKKLRFAWNKDSNSSS